MAQTIAAPQKATSTVQIGLEEYMARYAHDHYEWHDGEIIAMSPVSLNHDQIVAYLRNILETYLTLNPIGRVVGEPFVMRVEAVKSAREPDLQVILNSNPGQLTETAMIGPADICVEVVSVESVERDYGKKFEEYEKGGVSEYWIIDPERKIAHFNRRMPNGLFTAAQPDSDGNYTTPLLPRLRLNVPTLWQDELPDIVTVVRSVQAMIEQVS